MTISFGGGITIGTGISIRQPQNGSIYFPYFSNNYGPIGVDIDGPTTFNPSTANWTVEIFTKANDCEGIFPFSFYTIDGQSINILTLVWQYGAGDWSLVVNAKVPHQGGDWMTKINNTSLTPTQRTHWYHFVLNCNSSNIASLYVDGICQGSWNNSSSSLTKTDSNPALSRPRSSPPAPAKRDTQVGFLSLLLLIIRISIG